MVGLYSFEIAVISQNMHTSLFFTARDLLPYFE